MIPWFDETYMIEAGRQFLCHGDADTTLIRPDGGFAIPLNYVGECFQELLFRVAGTGVTRAMPMVCIVAFWYCFRWWLKKSGVISRPVLELLALIGATSTLLFQSTVMVRVDVYALTAVFAALAIMGPPTAQRGHVRLAAGAALAALSVYIWPSALMLGLIYPACCFNWERRREFGWFCAYGVIASGLLMIPLLPVLPLALDAFSQHAGAAAYQANTLSALLEVVIRETARSPLVMIMAAVGLAVWIRQKRYVAIAALVFGMGLGTYTTMYSMRFVYLLPLLLLMAVDAVKAIHVTHPRMTKGLLVVAVGYGFLAGPIGHWMLPREQLATNTEQRLEELIGRGPIRVFAPDYATYYIGRELGWKQLAFTEPWVVDDAKLLSEVLASCDFVVLREWDPYRPIQECCSLYGLLCRYLLQRAKIERELPLREKSLAAQVGSRFVQPWRKPLSMPGFRELGMVGVLKVYGRERAEAKL